jgi:alanyl-tRNA synthetase
MFLCVFYCWVVAVLWFYISHCRTVAVIVFDIVMQKESCELAWDLLVGHYGLNPSRLYVTYFGGDCDLGLGPDLETRDIWRQIG